MWGSNSFVYKSKTGVAHSIEEGFFRVKSKSCRNQKSVKEGYDPYVVEKWSKLINF